MPKSKCIKLEAWGDPDNYGNVYHKIEFEDGIEGNYKGNPEKGLKYEVGVEGDYVVEELKTKKGDPFIKIKPPPKEGGNYNSNQSQGKTNSSPYKKSPKEQKQISYQVAIEQALRFIIFHIEPDQVWEKEEDEKKAKSTLLDTITKFYLWLVKDSPEQQQSMIKSSSLKRAVDCLSIPFLKIVEINQVLTQADKFVSAINSVKE